MKEKLLADYISILSDGLEKTNFAEDRNLIQKYIANIAPILAKAVLGEEIGSQELQDHDRLWGQTWLQDESLAKAASAKWEEFENVIGYLKNDKPSN